MEDLVFDHMISKIGWSAGDGTFAPGGTISNLYALLLARYKFDPRVKTEGVHLHKFVVFTSEHVSLIRIKSCKTSLCNGCGLNKSFFVIILKMVKFDFNFGC